MKSMKEKLFVLLGRGEGEDVEFKRKDRSVVETVCAFANTFGGNVLVGVTDDARIVGITRSIKERVSTALHALNPYPDVRIHTLNVDGKELLLIEVKKSDALVFYGTRAYIRVGRSNRPLSIEEMVERSVELTALNFDSLASPHGKDVIKREYVRWYLERREKMRGVPMRGTLEENMIKLKVLVRKGGNYRASYGGILFFTENPAHYINSSSLRIIDFRGAENVNIFEGPVWKIIDDSYQHLLKSLKIVEFRVGARRERVLEYPEEGMREAIINAVAHRNYLIAADVRIFIYDDRLIIRSPGSFPPGVSVENPEHHPRNPLLCSYLYDTGYIERYGFGIQRIKDSCERHPFCSVEFNITPSRVDVIFSKSEIGLNDLDRKIIAFLKGMPRSSSEIAKHVGMSKVAILARLKKLMAMGIVKKIGNGPSTRYLS